MPIRWRLTLTFAAVMAVLLAGLIAFLYHHFRSDLDYNINQSLSARAQDIAGLVRQEDAADTSGALRQLPASPDNVVQVLDQSGRVLGAAGVLSQPALLSPGELPTAQDGAKLIQRKNSLRLYALPLPSDHKVVVAGVSLAERDAALDKLDNALLIGVPPALLLAILAAYGLAAAALRPVERMRQRAATISTDEISTRLPLPESRDEIRRLGDTLNEILDRLEDGLNHERMFIANASHELRMPLAVLKAELEVSLRERGGERALRDAMGSAIEETDRIIKLAEDLLLLARAEDGTLPIDAHAVTVEELLVELGARFSPVFERAGRPLEVDAESVPAGTAVRADPDRIEQAIANLIDNTLRYGDGPTTLSARVADGTVEIHVTDSGPGFGQQFLPHAFDRFSRGDPARRRGGVGLGLAIVRTIAQTHAGDAGARDIPGGGADAWISLPAAAELAVWRERDPV
ncbi:MAG: HAMP domain-containing sensor histidine kinase [Solirubrobacteraceae bacterium]